MIDPVIGLLLRLSARDDVPASAEAARRDFGKLIPLTWYRGGGRAGGIEDIVLDGALRARAYRPRVGGRVPTVIFFHGGGWVVGGIEAYDYQCRRLRDLTNAVVLSVDYRLAPEAPFPGAVEDALAAARWAVANAASLGGDAARIGIAGDSAGANLATVTAGALARDGVRLRAQLLLYPAVDSVGLRSGEASRRFPSHERFRTGYFLTLARMQWYADQYVPHERDRADPRASPLRSQDLAMQPPAVVATAAFDPLLDEGRAYANALRDAGVPVTYLEFPSLVHGFFALATLSPGARAAARACSRAFAAMLT